MKKGRWLLANCYGRWLRYKDPGWCGKRAPIWLLPVALVVLMACYPPSRPLPPASPSETRPDGAVRLTTPSPGTSDQNPAFSPDGSRLVFTRFDNGYNAGPAGLFLLDLGSLQATRLTPVEDQDNVNLPGAAWLGGEGGGRIVFASDRLEPDDGFEELWRIAPDGTDFTRITSHSGPQWYIEPSWSPGGQWIVFEADASVPDDQQQGSIWKVRADGTGLTQLTPGPAGGTDDRQPNWSPRGDRILFQRRSPGSDDWNIYTIAPDGSDLRQVTSSPASDTDASWSPNGACIVYSSDHGGLPVPNIFVIAASGGQPSRITFSATNEDGAPSWSGDWIAFESHEGQGEDTPSALWRISAADVLCDGAADLCPVCLPVVFKNATRSPADWWQPAVGTSWQWQLTGPAIDPSFDAEMYDIDLFDNEASTVAALHAQGRKVICYLSAGSWEDWRPDADQFPASVLGNAYEGWPGERWLDIRQIDLLAPIMGARLDQCQAKGFDGVEPDNIDGYTNDTGFPLTYQDQLDYNLWLAAEAHARGLSIGLKNDDEQVGDLLSHFDWALTEDCFAQDWCDEVAPFVSAGKAVFAAEYTDELTTNQFLDQVCPQAGTSGLSAILKNRDLDAWREACPPSR
jgi:Tol biopolymer transport system component